MATDLGVAWPPETALRTCLVGIARALEEGEDRERGARAAAHLLSPAGLELADRMCLAHRDVGRRFAARLGLGGAVADGLGQVYERWDGRGMPGPLAGEQIPLVVRVVHVAYVAEAAFRDGGPALAAERDSRTARSRSSGVGAGRDQGWAAAGDSPIPLRSLPGRVTLVGAGPGGADLITLRGWQALHAADVW